MSQSTSIISPNTSIMPYSAETSALGHLVMGGCDTVELAERFGTPLWVLDELTIRQAVEACKAGLSSYPKSRALYAGKAFLCTAMVHLIHKLGLGLDVVSEGELYTAQQANFPADLLYMHGNNKTRNEIETALKMQDVKIVVDNEPELDVIAQIARGLGIRAKIMLRVTPGVEPDTHIHIKTGQHNSKFGFPLLAVDQIVQTIISHKDALNLVGLHAHIGSQSKEIEPFLKMIDIFADLFLALRDKYDLKLPQLDVGGGLGITYTEEDKPISIYEWASNIAERVAQAFSKRALEHPELLVEPGRSIVGTAGVTLYRAGYEKNNQGDKHYLALDGGMADNPRPITYQAKYTARIANRMNAQSAASPLTLVGKYCESGDIIVKDVYLPAQSGDLIAIFGTGAYNYSMASNYNRTGRPACVLVSDGEAEVIIERENNEDLLRHDRVPKRLLRE